MKLVNKHLISFENMYKRKININFDIILRTNQVLSVTRPSINITLNVVNQCKSRFFTSRHRFPTIFYSQAGRYIENMYRQYSSYGILDIKPNVSLYDIKKYLNSYHQDYQDGFTSLNMSCPLCINSEKRKLYINKTTGSFICDCCQHSGQWATLKDILKVSKEEDIMTVLPIDKTVTEVADKWKEKYNYSQNITTLDVEERKRILDDYKIPDIPTKVFDILDARIHNDRSCLIFPVKNHNNIIGYKEIAVGGYESTFPSQGCQGLIIVTPKKSKGKKEAVLVTSIQDMLALVVAKISQDIICLPHGHFALPQEILPKLEGYSKLILWFGNSEIRWDSARQFAKKLSELRCFFVRPIETQPAPYLSLEEGRNLEEIVDNATPIWHSCVTNFASLRQDVLSQLQNVEKAKGVKWKRFPTLTHILRGHRRGEMTILTGPTGSGKTTFMSEYSLDLASQGVTTLWGSFEIRTERLICTMMTQMAKLPLATHLDKFNTWADQFEQLPLYFLTFHGQQPLKTVMEAVEHATYVHDIAHVIIDNVQFMLGMSSDEAGSLDRFYRQDAIIAAFRNFATSTNCHVTLVIHPRKEKDGELLTSNSIFGGVKASQESDNILIIQQKTLQSLKLKKFLQIAKNRYCGDLGVMPLEFDKPSLSFAEKKGKQEDKPKIPEEDNLHIL